MKRNSLKRILAVLLPVMMILFAFPVIASAGTPDSIPLIAGQNTQIGNVSITNDGDLVSVTYNITESDWFLTETHTYIGTTAPAKNAPGKFPYSSTGLHDSNYTETATITGSSFYIAAHAVVTNENDIVGCKWPTWSEVSSKFPVSGKFTISYGTESKFAIDVFDDSFLNGLHKAWCIDMDHGILVGPNVYLADFYSSYGSFPTKLITQPNANIDYPENLDLLNWVINHDDSYGLNLDQIQMVIWHLIDANPERAMTTAELVLYNDAINFGEGFVPDFANGDVFGVLVDTTILSNEELYVGQTLLLEQDVDCTPTYNHETAWGIADNALQWSKSKSWGSYFLYTK